MKILHIGQMIGGLDVYIRNTICNADNAYKYVIVHGKNDKSNPVIKNGERIKEYLIDFEREINIFRDFFLFVSVFKIALNEKPDVIHCHSAKGGIIGRLIGYLLGVRTYYTPHAFSFLSTGNKLKSALYQFVERNSKFKSYLLACSESEMELGINRVGYSKKRALCWHNSVPDIKINKFDAVDENYICCIGRPSYQKNSIFLVDVVNAVHKINSEIKFYLLGVGFYSPDLAILKNKIEEYGLVNVISLVPWLDHDSTMRYIKKSKLYLTVSRYEGLPLSVIEAMALGKSIIASDVVGNIDCISDNINGKLLPLRVEPFANAILDLWRHDSKRTLFESNSRKLFEKNFLIDKRISLLENIYNDVDI